MAGQKQEKMNEMRLGDRILFALELALDQGDVTVSAMLANALETAMTRNAGGKDFTERRSYSDDVATALRRMEALRKQSGS